MESTYKILGYTVVTFVTVSVLVYVFNFIKNLL